MRAREPQISPAIEQTTAAAGAKPSSSVSQSVEVLKTRFPFLKNVDSRNPQFRQLATLLQEVTDTSYNRDTKYQLMYKIIKIGALVEELVPEVKAQSAVLTLEKCQNTTMNVLSETEQMATFQISRNIAADYFHVLYDNKLQPFFERFQGICGGSCDAPFLVAQMRSFTKLGRGDNVVKLLADTADWKERATNLLLQTTYFLKRSNDLLKKEDLQGAYMSFIAAGTCARMFNISKIESKHTRGNKASKDEIDVSDILIKGRKRLAHERIAHDDSASNEYIRENVTDTKIAEYLDMLQKKAAALDLILKVDDYYATRSSSSESPRALKQDVFAEGISPSAAASAARAASNQVEPSVKDSRRQERLPEPRRQSYTGSSSSSQHPTRRDDDRPQSGHQDFQHRGDEARRDSYGASSSRQWSEPSSGYDRERDRDEDRYQRSHESRYSSSSDNRERSRRYESHGEAARAASSSSSSSSSDRYAQQRFSALKTPQPGEHESQQSAARDKKRTHSDSTGCREDDLRYNRRDDYDEDDSRSRHRELQSSQQHPSASSSSSGTSGTQTSTQSSSHSHGTSGRTSKRAMSDDQAESYVAQESASSHAERYGANLGRQKQWHANVPAEKNTKSSDNKHEMEAGKSQTTLTQNLPTEPSQKDTDQPVEQINRTNRRL